MTAATAEKPAYALDVPFGLVNLKELGLRAGDTWAIWYESPAGNAVEAQSVQVRDNCVWFEQAESWQYLDTRALNMALFAKSLILLPLPKGLQPEGMGSMAKALGLQAFTLVVG